MIMAIIIHLQQKQKSVRLLPDLCKRIKMHLDIFCLLTYQTEPQNVGFMSKTL